jgi:hypothetical protein
MVVRVGSGGVVRVEEGVCCFGGGRGESRCRLLAGEAVDGDAGREREVWEEGREGEASIDDRCVSGWKGKREKTTSALPGAPLLEGRLASLLFAGDVNKAVRTGRVHALVHASSPVDVTTSSLPCCPRNCFNRGTTAGS